MSSESNYAGASVMSEGSQASFVVEDEMLDANVNVKYLCIELLNGFMCNIVNANDVM